MVFFSSNSEKLWTILLFKTNIFQVENKNYQLRKKTKLMIIIIFIPKLTLISGFTEVTEDSTTSNLAATTGLRNGMYLLATKSNKYNKKLLNRSENTKRNSQTHTSRIKKDNVMATK